MERRVEVFNASKVPLKEANKELPDAYIRYTLLKKSAEKMRKEWMKELAARQAIKYAGTTASRLATMLHHENQRRAHRIITIIMGIKRKGGVTTVEVKLNPNTKQWISTSSKDRIE